MSRRLAILWLLYFVQGLPFGFQVSAVPVLLREAGASLTVISLAGGAISAPWLLKPLWAPWVDASATRKAWIVPMQAALALGALATGAVGDARILPLALAVGAMNLFAATLDIAVDGLAVDMLRERDLGMGNAAQVVGYKLGMLSGGGLLLWLSSRVGFTPSLVVMALVIAVALGVTWRFREPPRVEASPRGRARPAYRATMRALSTALAAPGAGSLALAVLSYKVGESVADGMFKPFLVDAGFDRGEIGLWLGTWGMLLSLAGSLAGGWLASRWSIWGTLALFACARIAPLAAQWWLTTLEAPSAAQVIGITCAEHFCGGGLTTAMFALMMSRTDRRIGATHFTALAALEVIGKGVPGLGSGPLTEAVGYGGAFGLSVTLSVAFLFVLPPLRRRAASPLRANGGAAAAEATNGETDAD